METNQGKQSRSRWRWGLGRYGLVRRRCLLRFGRLTDLPKEELRFAQDVSEDRARSPSIPTSPLFVFYCMVNGCTCEILKEDGFNMNIISTHSVKRNGNYFEIINQKICIEHSNDGSSERTNGIVVDAVVQIGKHQYRYNWIILNCTYDVLLGRTWHKGN